MKDLGLNSQSLGIHGSWKSVFSPLSFIPFSSCRTISFHLWCGAKHRSQSLNSIKPDQLSVIVCFILGFHGGLQNRVFFPKELTTVNDTRRRCPGKVMAVGSFPSLICDKTGSAEHLHYLVKVTIVADEHFGPWCG